MERDKTFCNERGCHTYSRWRRMAADRSPSSSLLIQIRPCWSVTMNRMTTRLVTPGVTVSSSSEVGRQQRHEERGTTSGHANEAMFMFSTAGIGFLFNMIVIISLLSSKSLRNTSGAFVIHGEALIVYLWYIRWVRHWSFICDTRWGIDRLYVIHGEALIVYLWYTMRHWSFICDTRWGGEWLTVRHWSFICDTRWGIGRLFVIHREALVVYLWYTRWGIDRLFVIHTVRHWSFICDTRWGIGCLFVIHREALIVYLWHTVSEALIVYLWYKVRHWLFICDTPFICTARHWLIVHLWYTVSEALIVYKWYTVRHWLFICDTWWVRHWSFICDTRWDIDRLFVIHGEALI